MLTGVKRVDLKARFHQAKLPVYEKECKAKFKQHRKTSITENLCKSRRGPGSSLSKSKRTWQLQLCGSGFRISKDKGKGLWNLPPMVKKSH